MPTRPDNKIFLILKPSCLYTQALPRPPISAVWKPPKKNHTYCEDSKCGCGE